MNVKIMVIYDVIGMFEKNIFFKIGIFERFGILIFLIWYWIKLVCFLLKIFLIVNIVKLRDKKLMVILFIIWFVWNVIEVIVWSNVNNLLLIVVNSNVIYGVIVF